MDQRTFSTLELDSLVEMLARRVQSPLGRRRAQEARPVTNRKEIEDALELTSECADYLKSGERFGLAGLEDPEASLAELQIEGTSLRPEQILSLERMLLAGMGLRELFKDSESRRRFPRLAAATARIPDFRRILSEVHGKILPGGEIDDNASPDLRGVRRELQHARSRIHRNLEAIMHGQARAIQEEIVTFRNGRFVIPIRTDTRGLISGVVHGLSSSGQTTFVEPLAVIEQNNELVRLREQEEAEILKVLFGLSELLRSNLTAIRALADIVTELDFAQAKGLLSVDFCCTRPWICQDGQLSLDNSRHILLEQALRQSGGSIVPISLDLDKDRRVLVISGPNAGGKTVVLKTVGLIALMAQMGLHVPAKQATLPIFDQIYADIGDQQSIASNLSTFTAHIRNIAEMAEKVSPSALLLLDEAGTGTDPDEGAALSIAILDHFRKTGAMAIATTHYHALKIWASQSAGVRSASVEFDEDTLKPTFRLLMDIAGASAGIEIARRMHLPDSILDSARTHLNPEHSQAGEYLRKLKATLDQHEALRLQMEKERQDIRERYTHLDLDFAKRDAARRAEFDEALARALREFASESERMICSIKDQVEHASVKRTIAKRTAELRRTAERLRHEVARSPDIALSPPADGSDDRSSKKTSSGDEPGRKEEITGGISVGDSIWLLSLDREGTVESIQDETYTVQVGSLRFRTDRDDLRLRTSTGPVDSGNRTGLSEKIPGVDVDREFVGEINVIGLSSDDALERVDKLMDQALLAGAETLRIIHGHGKGILRRAIAKYLSDHPQVNRFQLAPPDKGGGGATLVELKK